MVRIVTFINLDDLWPILWMKSGKFELVIATVAGQCFDFCEQKVENG